MSLTFGEEMARMAQDVEDSMQLTFPEREIIVEAMKKEILVRAKDGHRTCVYYLDDHIRPGKQPRYWEGSDSGLVDMMKKEGITISWQGGITYLMYW